MKKLLIAVALGATSLSASAEGYLGLGYGTGKAKFSETTPGTPPSLKDGSVRSLKVFGGYKLSKHFALEIGYQQLDDFSWMAVAPTGTASYEYEATAITADLIGSVQAAKGVHLFLKAGLAKTELRTNTTFTGAFSGNNEEESEVNPHYGVGLLVNLTKHVGVRFQYEKLLDVGKEITTGEVGIETFNTDLVFRF